MELAPGALPAARRRRPQMVPSYGSRAAALARTPEEQYRSVELLARLECDAGHHREALRLAHTLLALRPRDERAWIALRHAAWCNHLEPLAQRASLAIKALEKPPGVR